VQTEACSKYCRFLYLHCTSRSIYRSTYRSVCRPQFARFYYYKYCL